MSIYKIQINYSLLPSAGSGNMLIEKTILEKLYFFGIVFEMRRPFIVVKSDKVVYYSANKAVEKNIFPEGLEPYTDFRPNEKIDAFVSEISIDKRMVTSTLIYGSLQKLMIELDRSVKDIMGISYDDSTV